MLQVTLDPKVPAELLGKEDVPPIVSGVRLSEHNSWRPVVKHGSVVYGGAIWEGFVYYCRDAETYWRVPEAAIMAPLPRYLSRSSTQQGSSAKVMRLDAKTLGHSPQQLADLAEGKIVSWHKGDSPGAGGWYAYGDIRKLAEDETATVTGRNDTTYEVGPGEVSDVW